jgi:hypothetical protein
MTPLMLNPQAIDKIAAMASIIQRFLPYEQDCSFH